MKKCIVIVFVLLVLFPLISAEYDVNDYQFEWFVYSSDSLKLSIVKKEDVSYIYLAENTSYSYDSIRILIGEIPSIIELLNLADIKFLEQKELNQDFTSEEQREDVKMEYQTSLKNGFSLILKNTDSIFRSGVKIPKKEISKIIDEFNDIRAKYEFVEKTIPF